LSDMRYVCGSQRRDDLKQHVEWLRGVPWQIFCTLTFAWSVSDAQAHRVFTAFVDRMERHLRCPLTYIRGDELRFSGCGKPAAPRHYHVLFAAERQLEPHWVATTWTALAGARANGAGAHVCEYDPNRNAIAYTLKLINQPNGDWSFKNLDLFIGAANIRNGNCRARRRIFRHGRIQHNSEKENSVSTQLRKARALRPGLTRDVQICKNRSRQPLPLRACVRNSVFERTERICRPISVVLDPIIRTATRRGSSRSPPQAVDTAPHKA